MKSRFILIVAFVFYAFSGVFANVNDSVFAPVGAKWYYGIQSSQAVPDTYYRTLEVIKDTVIEGKQCAVLQQTEFYKKGQAGYVSGYEYLYYNQQKVYRWNKTENEFTLLYDFSANAGDSWQIPCLHCGGQASDSSITIHVDSVKYINISGKELKQLSVSSDGLYSFGTNYIHITERIGGSGYMFLFGYAYDDMDIPHLRCYSDSDISVSFSSEACDSIYTWSPSVPKYFPFPTDSAKWNYIHIQNDLLEDPNDTTFYTFMLDGDTTFNNVVYHKLVQLGEDGKSYFVLGIREESKKIYCYPFIREYSKAEEILYDFSKQIGDTVWHCPNDSLINKDFYSVIKGIDSIEINGEFRKRFLIQNHFSGEDYWVEGVGSIKRGLFDHLYAVPTCACIDYNVFVCFSQNGNLIYRNPQFNDCTPIISEVKTPVAVPKVKIYADAQTGVIHVKNINAPIHSVISVFDILGNKIISRKLGPTDTSFTMQGRSGIFLVRVSDENGRILALQKVISH